MRLFAVGLFWLLMVFDVRAADTLAKGPPPAWVQPVALRANPAADTLGAFRAELFEQQFHFDADGWHLYVRTRMVIQSPQALSAFGTVGIQWNPAFQSVTVHGVTLHRGSQVIDVLAGQDFVVLRREANLESATLDGQLTGTLQLNDLRVGDTIETSYTFDTRIPVLGDHAEFITTGAVPAVVDQYALRGSWPTTQGLRLRVSEGERPA